MTPAFILHKRPYQNTSLLIDAFTEQDGRIRLVARGAKRPKSSLAAVLQTFTPLYLDYQGKHDLHTLKKAETQASSFLLQHDAVFCGFYLNELLLKLLPLGAQCEDIFSLYHDTLKKLQINTCLENTLRFFEKYFLAFLGYGIHFAETLSHEAIHVDSHYVLHANEGFIESPEGYRGQQLLAIEADDFSNTDTLKTAKYIFRHLIQVALGDKTINSKTLFA